MSDEAHMSSPTSPTRPVNLPAANSAGRSSDSKECLSQSLKDSNVMALEASPEATPEPTVEQKLGRKRCIMFACSRQPSEQKPLDQALSGTPPAAKEPAKTLEPLPKRPCALKFLCPSKVSSTQLETSKRPTRHTSPPPPQRLATPSPDPRSSRVHRDSDTTVKNESPRTARKVAPMEPRRRLSVEVEEEDDEPAEFHEFASRGQQIEDWVQESTCHRSRLTVDDTLNKEKTIRQIGEEAEEEALEEEALEDALSGAAESDEDDEDDMISDAGFQTDDEEGFAESDDEESDDDSEYDWWNARRASPAQALMAPGDAIRPPAMHAGSVSSLNSIVSPMHRDLPPGFPGKRRSKPRSKAIPIRAPTPELPDSTDFVCGTLDEDKPLEEAYMSCMEQRRLAKRPATAQDIDPTFPDEPIDLDDEEDEDDGGPVATAGAHEEDLDMLPHGEMEDLDEEAIEISDEDDMDNEPRGRRREPRDQPSPQATTGHTRSNTPRVPSSKRLKSPMPTFKPSAIRPKSPMPTAKVISKRPKSPMPISSFEGSTASARGHAGPVKKGPRLRSPPPPRALFGHSPRRTRSPIPATKLKSPPPSRRGSPISVKPMVFGTAFLGQRPQLTHTASLPRSPNPFAYKRAPFVAPTPRGTETSDGEDEEDTATETNGYSRGAIDIVQGLERKRLRRRQKFYEKYCRKEEKKRERGELKRPLPGKGAERMRQVGIECAIYRGKRVLSV